MSCQILAHFGFHESYTFQKVGTGSNKRPEKLNVHIRNSWRTNLQLIRSIGNMIGYKKSLSEWQCLSEVKMGRGSPIPPMLRLSKHDPEAQAFSLGQGSFKMDCGKVENCSVVRRIKI